MPRDHEHLALPELNVAVPRRKRGGGRPPERENNRQHGRTLLDQTEDIRERLQHRLETSARGINPKLVFKLIIHPKGNLDEQQLRLLNLRLLGRDADKQFVVFPNDAALTEMRRMLREYAGLDQRGHEYAYLAAIEEIQDITPEDRIGKCLREMPLGDEENIPLDIELWHSGDKDECRQKIIEIDNLLVSMGLKITDSWIGSAICLIRARVNQQALTQLLQIDYIKEIDRRPRPSFEVSTVHLTALGEIIPEDVDLQTLVGILIIDSGVMQGHPLLGPVLADAQVFPDRNNRVQGGPEDGDKKAGGHGTAVAGIAVYGDIAGCIEDHTFRPTAHLYSARVTDSNNEYNDEDLLEHQLEQAVDYFLENYPKLRVINISLGNLDRVYFEGRYQFRFAAAIDELAYKYQDRNIVFVVSTGNIPNNLMEGEEILGQYPQYLLQNPESRIIDPGTSAIALTIGGLSFGSGHDLRAANQDMDIDRCVAGQIGWPSPFTRVGWGVDGAIKPEVVETAGDWVFSRGRILSFPSYAGIPSTSRDFAPPNGLFRTVNGTSFSTPKVANLAARLIKEFPEASSNLIRALIIDSAKIPSNRPECFMGLTPVDDDILRVYGYGQPDFERARWSEQNEVLLLYQGEIEIDNFRLFRIPSLPPEYLSTDGDKSLSVTLAFDPPTRHTRGDSYLGVTMEFSLFRNVQPDQIISAMRANIENYQDLQQAQNITIKALKDEYGPSIEIDLFPSKTRRINGTLQKGSHFIRGRNWRYIEEIPLVLSVTCSRKWAPREITHQRFALIASIKHGDPTLDLYAHIIQQTRLFQRVRIQI